LILSQVILSLQLSFAVVPLVQFTSDRAKMGEFANGRWLTGLSWAAAGLIIVLNAWLLVLLARPGA
jgi:manganese transport protein